MYRRVAFAIAASIIAGSALAVAPQRTFVASYGLDSNPCSLSAPCRGFQSAIDVVAAGGEVVALDSAGYGAMEIHKSVSVIVPPGVHAGLSPSAGIPLPGYPGQYGVVLIDIQDTDVVVLRGLNINHQGTVTGGIEWISAHGGRVQVESAVINGFPKEGIYMQAPSGRLLVKDSVIRNNGVGIYGGIAGGGLSLDGIFGDHVRIDDSPIGVHLLSGVGARFIDSAFTSNGTALFVEAATDHTALILDRCSVLWNNETFSLFGAFPWAATLEAAASTLLGPPSVTRTGNTNTRSWGNNSTNLSFDQTFPSK